MRLLTSRFGEVSYELKVIRSIFILREKLTGTASRRKLPGGSNMSMSLPQIVVRAK